MRQVCALCGLTTCLCLGNCRFSHFFHSFLSFSLFQFHFHNQDKNLWGPHGKLTCILGLRETCFHFHWTKSETQFVAQCWRCCSCCNNDSNNKKLFNPILIYHLARGLRKLWHKIKKNYCSSNAFFASNCGPIDCTCLWAVGSKGMQSRTTAPDIWFNVYFIDRSLQNMGEMPFDNLYDLHNLWRQLENVSGSVEGCRLVAKFASKPYTKGLCLSKNWEYKHIILKTL